MNAPLPKVTDDGPDTDASECPYEVSDPRTIAWCEGYLAALRWVRARDEDIAQ